MTHLPQTVWRAMRQSLLWVWASPNTLLGLLVGGIGLLSGGTAQRMGRTIEFQGGFVTWSLSRLGRGASAMTLGHVILGQTSWLLEATRRHELVHVRQYEYWGPVFLPAYGLCALWLHLRGRNGYWDNPFERQAYAEAACGEEPRTCDDPTREDRR
ncbi:MAG: hypothetical protein ACK5Q5_13000 [Planctomycetaceae bacterium]